MLRGAAAVSCGRNGTISLPATKFCGDSPSWMGPQLLAQRTATETRARYLRRCRSRHYQRRPHEATHQVSGAEDFHTRCAERNRRLWRPVHLDKKKYQQPVLVSSADGVGTKLKIAFETGYSSHGGRGPGESLRERHCRTGCDATVLPGLSGDRQARCGSGGKDCRRTRRSMQARMAAR